MSSYSDSEVFLCGKCRRQQDPKKGEKCVQCGRGTVIWNTDKESAAAAQARWERLHGRS